MSALPRIKTGMSAGRLASARVWITGYLGGAFFFNRSSSARRAFTLALGFARQHSLDLLELVSRDLLFQSRRFRLEERM